MLMRNDEGGKMQEKETLDERLPGLFEPDTLLPIQYFEAMRRKHLLEGEKRLVLSVLEDAVECFMKCIDSATNKGQRLYRDAEDIGEWQEDHRAKDDVQQERLMRRRFILEDGCTKPMPYRPTTTRGSPCPNALRFAPHYHGHIILQRQLGAQRSPASRAR